MGSGIAQTLAMHGFEVCMVDTEVAFLECGIENIRASLARLVKKGTLTEITEQDTLNRIHKSLNLEKCVPGSEVVIEAVPEKFELKAELFKKLDALVSEQTILATNTSSISVTRLANVNQRPQRVIGMHFMNPVPLMKLVEVINGYETSGETTARILALSKKIGKEPVEVKDYPGFVANRILMPMINEAIYTLYEGIAGRDEIDAVMRLGMAHPMGPLRLADLIGLDTCLSIMEVLYQGFRQPKYAPCPLLVNMVHAGKTGVKSGEGFYKYFSSRSSQDL